MVDKPKHQTLCLENKMKLVNEKGRRGGRVHTRLWDMGDNWEMKSRKCGSHYEWNIYQWDEERVNSTHDAIFYTKIEAMRYYKEHSNA